MHELIHYIILDKGPIGPLCIAEEVRRCGYSDEHVPAIIKELLWSETIEKAHNKGMPIYQVKL